MGSEVGFCYAYRTSICDSVIWLRESLPSVLREFPSHPPFAWRVGDDGRYPLWKRAARLHGAKHLLGLLAPQSDSPFVHNDICFELLLLAKPADLILWIHRFTIFRD